MSKIIHIITHIMKDIVLILSSVIFILVLYFSVDSYLTDRNLAISGEKYRIEQEKHKFDVVKAALFDNAFMYRCLSCIGGHGKPYFGENKDLLCEYPHTEHTTTDTPNRFEQDFSCCRISTLKNDDVNDTWVNNVASCLQLLSENRNVK